jgi:hypothetical protein
MPLAIEASSPDKIICIGVPETRFSGYPELYRARAEEKGLEFVLLEGSTGIPRKLIRQFTYFSSCPASSARSSRYS